MDFPEELKYSKEHIWVRVEGNRGVIGITDYAQQELGTITVIELPSVGDELEQDDSFGSVEARKTVADLYAPLSGSVAEVNGELRDAPEIVNDDPYDSGWLVVVDIADHEELNLLMSAELYEDYVAESR
ncbi:glycine cleavage system protein GcvH [Geotalea uraniireducens]|uniref:Glycine cleavage system H protein n=1 Tax=Geotalea uraniireducens (strain Rf4) TaxID=351605 RepID=A5GF12_GEOUR|nr:glycine cleavage system protein GcvH [Geotalea uraniireducens]ABQ26017.1 glycine cleavage system H protein [Geotalea uraniireducens Rf4]